MASKKHKDRVFIEKVYFNGYKTLNNVKIDLMPDINILIGKNGTGKSNFLEFLDHSVYMSSRIIAPYSSFLRIKKYGVAYLLSLKSSNHISSSNGHEFIEPENIQYSLRRIEEEAGKEKKHIILKTHNRRDFVFKLRDLLIKPNVILIRHGIPGEYPLINQPLSFSVEKDETSIALLELIMRRTTPYFIKYMLTLLFNKSREIQGRLATDNIDNEKLKSIFLNIFNQSDEIKTALINYAKIQDYKINSSFNVSTDHNKQSFKIYNLFFEFKVNGEWFPFSSLSDGVQRMIYLISEIAIPSKLRFDEYSFGIREDEEQSVILLEEPELSIHPHQLDKLLQFIREYSSQKQFIISTHSPQVLDILNENELDRIILANLTNENNTVLRHLNKAEMEKAKRYMKEEANLSDYWRHSDLDE
ncbi:MAG: AAA family ATPase [Bacteroidales bacterium]|nr:AAA family ATPase [Bacteroidales bacterium]